VNFLNEVSNFRKALANSRYAILDRFKAMCSDAKSGIATLFVILFESIRRGKAQFQREKETNEGDWNVLRSSHARDKGRPDQLRTESFLTNVNKVTSDYNRRLTDLIRFVSLFVQGASDLAVNFKVVSDKHKRVLLQSIGSNFELAQSPLPWVKSVCEMFENCTVRLYDMAVKLKDSQNELLALSQKLKRHIEISISLLQTTLPETNTTLNSRIQYREDGISSNITGQIAFNTNEI
jgi:dihydroorotate dehydrogenase